MSFIPSVCTPLDSELAQAKQAEIEAQAERYAQLHAYQRMRRLPGHPYGT